MSAFLLMRAIRAHLEEQLHELPLATPGRDQLPGGTRPARVFIGDLPPKKDGPDQEFPFVLLQARSGFGVDLDGDKAEVLVRCGVYCREGENPREAAEEDLSNLVSHVRRRLRPFSAEALASKYCLEADSRGQLLSWETPDNQPGPYAECWIVSIWGFQA